MGKKMVKRIQAALNLILNKNLTVDGIIGPNTKSAIKEFQKEAGIGVDGVAGPKTKQAFATILDQMGQQATEMSTYFNGVINADDDSDDTSNFGMLSNFQNLIKSHIA